MDEITLQINELKSYFFTKKGAVPAVDGVTISVPRGKIVGIVGESGCGKSMTAKSIMNLLKYPGKVVGGEILLDGVDLTKKTEREMKKIRGKDVSMIFQEPMTSLNPVMKVGKQIQEALKLHQNLSSAEAKQKVYEIFAEVGISEPEKRYNSYPHELSGGLRQRAMIAMAMICRPKLLIADEPTTALDVTIEAQILQLMKKLSHDFGMSIIIISHNLGVIAEMCDFVYVMYAGKVVEQADVFKLFEAPSHPYTLGLMGSIITPEDKRERLSTISGVVPNLLHLPQGCSFSNRCERVMELCRKKKPELYSIKDEHCARCFLHEGKVLEG